MEALEVLYIALGVAVLVLVAVVTFTAFQIIVTLRTLRKVLENLSSITRDLKLAKDAMKIGVLGRIISGFTALGRLRRV